MAIKPSKSPNALCWYDQRRAIKLLAQTVLESWLFNPKFGQNLITLTFEFRHAPAYWSEDTCRLWDILSHTYDLNLDNRLLVFNQLAENSASFQLSDQHQSILKIVTAQLLTTTGHAEKGISLCDAITDEILQDSSLHTTLADAYGEAGTALGFYDGIPVASEKALHAYKRANDLQSHSHATYF